MSGDIDIVPAGPELAAALAAVHAASFPTAWDETAMRRLLGANASRAFVALEGYDHVPLGFVLAFVAVDEAEILSLAVLPERRRQGLARRLVQHLEAAAMEAGAERLFLEVETGNDAALALYRKLGFVEVGRRKDYYVQPGAEPQDALVLAKPLAAGG